MDESNDIAKELAMLQTLTGIDFSHKLEQICRRKEFHLVKDEIEIYTAVSEQDDDYEALIAAARLLRTETLWQLSQNYITNKRPPLQVAF
jgi:hypothetical protein